MHLQEERGQRPEGGEGGDEEALSAVMGTGGFKGKDSGGGAWRRGVSMNLKVSQTSCPGKRTWAAQEGCNCPVGDWHCGHG